MIANSTREHASSISNGHQFAPHRRDFDRLLTATNPSSRAFVFTEPTWRPRDFDISAALCSCPLMEIRVLTSSSVHSRGLDDFIAGQMIYGKSNDGLQSRRTGGQRGRFVPVGGRSALASVTWRTLRRNGSVAGPWRQPYNFVRLAESWSAHLAMPRQLNASSNLFVRPSIAIMLAANPRSNTKMCLAIFHLKQSSN